MGLSEGIVVGALFWWQHLLLAEGRIVEISLSYSAVLLLRSLELEIAVPRIPLKFFTSGGRGAAVEIPGIRDSSTQEAINTNDV